MTTESTDAGYRGASMSLQEELQALERRLEAIDPNLGHVDNAEHRLEIDEVRDAAQRTIPQALAEMLSRVTDPEAVEQVRNATGLALAEAAGLLHAAGRTEAAQAVLLNARDTVNEPELAERFAAGVQHPDAFSQYIRARWLFKRTRYREFYRVVDRLAATAASPLREAAQRLAQTPRPISEAPTLFTINGFGVRIYGERDRGPDGAYTTTRFVTALFIPVLPIDAYRVRDAGAGQIGFEGQTRLGWAGRIWQIAVALGAVAAIVGVLISGARNTPSAKLARGAEVIATSELEPDQALERYAELLLENEEASAKDCEIVVQKVTRLLAASVPSPVTVDDLPHIDQAMLRFHALPGVAHEPAAAAPMVAQLEAWAAEIDGETTRAALAKLDILAYAKPLASDANRIHEQQVDIERRLAESLAARWPIEAVRHYVALGNQVADLQAAGELMVSLGEGPSIWAELEPEVARWSTFAKPLGEVADARKQVVGWSLAAQRYLASPERLEVLRTGDPERLAELIAAHPGDQQAVVTLAEVRAASGDIEAAIALLEGLGEPGRLVSSAQLALSRMYMDADRPAEAQALLEPVVANRLPAFRGARRSFSARVQKLERNLIARARRDDLPATWRSKFEATSGEAEVQQVFDEWLNEVIEGDGEVRLLRERYTSMSDIVPIAMQLGTIQLRRAQAAKGHEREALLAAAERSFMSVASERQGTPSFHIGLGEVYIRLGRDAEGEAEFAKVEAMNDEQASLSLAYTYRELGKPTQAQAIAERLFAATKTDVIRYRTARFLSLLAMTNDDKAKWLRKADPNDPFVEVSLLELEGHSAFEKGDLDTCDSTFAKAAGAWQSQGLGGGSNVNNAAVAMMQRYRCSGDARRLREASELLQQAQRMNPNSGLVAGNLASAVEYEALIGLLDRWIPHEEVRPGSSTVTSLLSSMRTGPHGADVLKAMQTDTRLRRAMDLYAQTRALAPSNPEAYQDGSWAVILRDVQRVEAVADRAEATELALDQSRALYEEYKAGKHDALIQQNANDALAKVQAAYDAAKSPASRAALKLIEAEERRGLLTLELSVEVAQQIDTAVEQAMSLWPAIGGHTRKFAAELELAVASVRAATPTLVARIDEAWRTRGRTGVLLAALDEPELAAALRAEPMFIAALETARALPNEALGSDHWLVARVANDDELAEQTMAQVRSPLDTAQRRLNLALDPTPMSREIASRMGLE